MSKVIFVLSVTLAQLTAVSSTASVSNEKRMDTFISCDDYGYDNGVDLGLVHNGVNGGLKLYEVTNTSHPLPNPSGDYDSVITYSGTVYMEENDGEIVFKDNEGSVELSLHYLKGDREFRGTYRRTVEGKVAIKVKRMDCYTSSVLTWKTDPNNLISK